MELTGRFWLDPAWVDLSEKWAVIDSTPGFFRDLQPLPGFLELWDWMLQFDPCILSAAGHHRCNQFTEAERRRVLDKREWCRQWLTLEGERVIIVPDYSEKAQHSGPGNILIDDSVRNIELWEEAGGTGIRHTSMPDTRGRLEELMAVSC